MGFTNNGADRFLNALVGQAVAVVPAANIKGKLHTAATPLAGNELSGGGYSDATLAVGNFSTDTDSGGRRLNFPAMQFFADAAADAQDAASFGLWHATTLIWSAEVAVAPNNAAVAAAAGAVNLSVTIANSTITFTNDALDRALGAISGKASAAHNSYWALHNTAGVPTASNQITGGGLEAIQDAAWSKSTVSGYRRFSQAALTFTAALTADTDNEPNRIALWRGDPDASGVLQAYWTIMPSGTTEDGASIQIPANQLYIELNLAGA